MILDDDVAIAAGGAELQIETPPPELLKEPLEFLFIEHYRHRQLCRVLEHLAEAPDLDRALTALALDFVRFDLALHVIDEEEDLFPLLRRRCEPDDEIEEVLGRLSGEHAQDQAQAKLVRALLEAALAEQTAASRLPGGGRTLRTFAAQQRSHLALENAIVMPLARRRLTAPDQEGMSRRLAARRGIML